MINKQHIVADDTHFYQNGAGIAIGRSYETGRSQVHSLIGTPARVGANHGSMGPAYGTGKYYERGVYVGGGCPDGRGKG